MIANISKGGFLQPLIEYNEKKVNANEAEILHVENSIKTKNDPEGYKNAISRISSLGYSSKRKDKFFHVSLNFPERDNSKLTKELLINVAKDYMDKMGFSEIPYVIYNHKDTNHPHIHIVTSNINHEKKAVSTSNDRLTSQKITRELEIKYDLTIVPSEKNKYKEELKSNHFLSLKEEINYQLKIALQKYRAQNIAELQNFLNSKNLDIQILKGVREVNGKKVEYDGVVFNKYDGTFKQQQKGIKGSSLYSKATLRNLEKSFTRNIDFHKQNRKGIRNQIDFVLSPYEKISIEELQKKLLLKDIILNYKYDSKYNLVGVSFTDNKTGYKYTGEQIGKNYTAKNISLLIGNKAVLKPSFVTTLNYNKVNSKLTNLTVNQKIQSLIALGFKVQYQANFLLISDYKNKPGEGYIKLLEGLNINPSIIDLYKNSKNIQFNNLTENNKLHFEYNRAIFENNYEKAELILNRIANIDSQNNENLNERVKHVKEYLDNLYQDVYYYQSDDQNENNTIADIDKNKKKRLKRKR